MVEHDHRAMVNGEVPKAVLQLLAIDDRLDVVADRRLDGDGSYRCLEPSSALRLVGGGVHEDAVQPAVEPFDVAKARQLPPAPDEGFLDRILGLIAVAQDQARDREQAIDLARGELPERLPIPAPCPLDEIRSHVDRRARTDPSTGFLPYDYEQ